MNKKERYELDNDEQEKLIVQRMAALEEEKSILKIRKANDWIAESMKTPIPKMLFDKFWHQGEICILFADTNLGKSILGVQIADSIAKGNRIEPFQLETESQAVFYFDFELTAKQFEARYSERKQNDDFYSNHYKFNDNLSRVEINFDAEIPKEKALEQYLIDEIESRVVEIGCNVLIIDNITYLSDDMERARDAAPLMKKLKSLKDIYNLSILVLAHTPKRNNSLPIGKNDLQGSKMIINFCDSCFAIGQSYRDSNLRYLKQVKSRNSEIIYSEDNIVLGHIEKDVNFLKFIFDGNSFEYQHLQKDSTVNKESLIAQAKALTAKGYTQREISKELNIALGTVSNYLKK
ncbi:MAG: AAA family ATPase [Flavobacteriales bacterium]|uniref:AAA family ATPase n=1 Tax=Candidatus Ulvibacter alkanivorans TaxID=2267620 RepID=UPI0014447942|nr:AAA family ATPase [Candidatus Ulvibacter alkanivorans]MCH2489282.1 AAA family ATPase [Flavobacteriales bacterium]